MTGPLARYTLGMAALMITLTALKLGAGMLMPLATAMVIWFFIAA